MQTSNVAKMQTTNLLNIFAAGFAMFSMFFGAGNLVFPLAAGQFAQNNNLYAITGLLITAVGVPFLGLLAITLFDGDYKKFFARIGRVPAMIIIGIIFAVIGPFGAMPRCLAFAYSTTSPYLPGVSLPVFSFFSCLLAFALTYRKVSIVGVLAYGLTPLKILAMAYLVFVGFLTATVLSGEPVPASTTFFHGLNLGYQTMDLLAAFFFSSVVIFSLKQQVVHENEDHAKSILFWQALKAGTIGMALLAITYTGLSYIAAMHSSHIAETPPEGLLGALATHLMGGYAGLMVSMIVVMSCLSTVITLTAVFSDYVSEELTGGRVSYRWGLVITLALTYAISTLEFSGIVAFLGPILQVMYPALIALSLLNIAHSLFNFKPVKAPVAAVFLITLFLHFWG